MNCRSLYFHISVIILHLCYGLNILFAIPFIQWCYNVVTQTTAVVVLVQASDFRIKFTTPVESMKGNAFKPEMKVTVRSARSRTGGNESINKFWTSESGGEGRQRSGLPYKWTTVTGNKERGTRSARFGSQHSHAKAHALLKASFLVNCKQCRVS
jgi:hypothetical protein